MCPRENQRDHLGLQEIQIVFQTLNSHTWNEDQRNMNHKWYILGIKARETWITSDAPMVVPKPVSDFVQFAQFAFWRGTFWIFEFPNSFQVSLPTQKLGNWKSTTEQIGQQVWVPLMTPIIQRLHSPPRPGRSFTMPAKEPHYSGFAGAFNVASISQKSPWNTSGNGNPFVYYAPTGASPSKQPTLMLSMASV